MEALAVKHGLPVQVELRKDELMVAGLGKDEGGGGILENYDGIIGFLSEVAGLPYRLNITHACIGRSCAKQVELNMKVEGRL